MTFTIFFYSRRSVPVPCLLPGTPRPPSETCCMLHPPNLTVRDLTSDMPNVPFSTRSCVTAAAGSAAQWQLRQSWRALCSTPRETRTTCHEEDLTVISYLWHRKIRQWLLSINQKKKKNLCNTSLPVDNAAHIYYICSSMLMLFVACSFFSPSNGWMYFNILKYLIWKSLTEWKIKCIVSDRCHGRLFNKLI